MNAKHYVSLEAAKKLKKINHDGLNYYMHIGCNGIICPSYVVGDNIYPAPTLLEAMDWLEERGIVIEITYDTIDNEWFSSVTILSKRLSSLADCGKDRNECMQKAIEKALELL